MVATCWHDPPVGREPTLSMPTPLLATKLYIPPPRPKVVHRPRLIERLNEGSHRKLILVSAPAGYGKSTLISEWIEGIGRPTAWLRPGLPSL